ncbi:sugar O-acetyltransferase [Pediococcus ethanolidurans]|uniref:sugar O-acetyltransferase n=1 Tax=Pediococcus ethanolidurans TaxID=319653 RepID=UPI0021E74636|nr:sugar O-acetyltransferase [Pediococcus ethanolidurans]MCV3321283.1 sugar O-acetyltransferase [Pediococcus ethanolidurans]MCV3556067.1 sugar O-acetyltransferase [Pediococcus ethanolidurans]
MMKTEREKMTAGESYQEFDTELITRRKFIRQQLQEINQITDNDNRNHRFQSLLAKTGTNFFVESEFKFDYGFNIHIGDHFYGNYDITMLDTCPITIGEHCYFGPNVGLYTPVHPLDAKRRNADVEMGAPITIGDSVWMGGRVTVLPGVTIGNRVVVGAGSVVTKSFPDDVVIVGNPARIIHHLDQDGNVIKN